MATAIHHGPPGSYKSFTLVQRFAIPALEAGRVVVTNVRGFDDLERVKDQFEDINFPESANIIWVNTTTGDGRKLMAQWWHWVPFGALMIIDEVQQIYPDRRDFKLESLDRFNPPQGLQIDDLTEYGIAEGRPEDVFTAFDKQRHYNWDIYCSTPNIAKVKREIREVTEWAYRHRDISGLLPWYKHRWMEHQHDPENNGKATSHRVGSPTQYQADPRIFKCYASTATGEHVQSNAGRTLLQDRKLLGLLGLILACIAFSIYLFQQRNDNKTPVNPDVQIPSETNHPANDNADHHVVAVASNKIPRAADVDTPLPYLDRSHALKWSIYGINREELTQVPTSCKVTTASVKCTLPRDLSLLQTGVDHICYPYLNATMCLVMFAINLPKPEPQDKNEQKTVLAHAVNFEPLSGSGQKPE